LAKELQHNFSPFPHNTIPHFFHADDTVLAASNKLYSTVVQTEMYAIKVPVVQTFMFYQRVKLH
jgi:hypothetical protein